MRPLLLVLMLGAAGVLIWAFSPTTSPTAPAEQFRQALLAYEQGDMAPVYAALQTLRDLPEFSEQSRLLEAAAELNAGHPDRALNRLASLPKDGPLRSETLLFAGEAFYDLHQLADAEMTFRMLAAEQPNLAAPHRWLGVIYFDLGAYSPAIAELQLLIEKTPDDYRPYRLIGLMLMDFAQYAEAIENYERALELNPPSEVEAELRTELARSLTELRRFDDALIALNPIPDTAIAQVTAAQCYWNTNRVDEAKQLLASAQELDPTILEGALLEADVRLSESDIDGALAIMQSAVQLHPHDAVCRYRLALLLDRAGRSDESAAEMAIYEEKISLTTRLAELNAQAISEPRNADLRDEIADVCSALGKHELSVMWREAAQACRDGTEEFSTPAESVTP